jgi:hypothetical protein
VTTTNPIRDIREAKRISPGDACEATGLTYSRFARIQGGSGNTTQEEIDHVVAVLESMPEGTRKQVGRPFSDPAKRAAVEAARLKGLSVSEALAKVERSAARAAGVTAPKKAAAPRKTASAPRKKVAPNLARALAKKAPSKAKQ